MKFLLFFRSSLPLETAAADGIVRLAKSRTKLVNVLLIAFSR
jgi:hypothetical protein